MELALFAIVAIVTIVGVEAFSRQLGIAAPLILIIVGIGYSFIPGLPLPNIPPEWILSGVIPPLLYAATLNVSLVDFRRSFRQIFSLSVLLVLVSTAVMGSLIYLFFPNIGFGAAFALGAVISPTDAVSAVAIGKRLGLPRGLLSILEGESLVNDATSLVLFKTAITAIGVSATQIDVGFSVLSFFYSAIVAVVVGIVVGIVTVAVRSRLRDPVLETAVSLIVPLIAYLVSEFVGASGVLAVVIAGFYTAHSGPRAFNAQARIHARTNWRTIQFVLESSVFLLMGVELSSIIGHVPTDVGIVTAIAVGLLVTVGLIALRFMFMIPLILNLRRKVRRDARAIERAEQGEQTPVDRFAQNRFPKKQEWIERRHERKKNDLEFAKVEGLSWRGGIILSWAGVRGVVTMAAAQSLPDDTPYRAQLILVAFTVVATTIIVEGGTLPFLIKLTGLRGSDAQADRREYASLLDEMTEAGIEALEDPYLGEGRGEKLDPAVVERARTETYLRRDSAWERANVYDQHKNMADSPHAQYRLLRKRIIAAEREVLLEARRKGTYSTRILARGQVMLDADESRIDAIDAE